MKYDWNIDKIKEVVIERPSIETLLKEKETMNFCEMGRKYSVSDNAIRKWLNNK